MPSTVALVVRCFNEEAHIGRLLTGVMRQTHVPEQTIVVDSGSTDATLAIVAAFPVEIVPTTGPPWTCRRTSASTPYLRATCATNSKNQGGDVGET